MKPSSKKNKVRFKQDKAYENLYDKYKEGEKRPSRLASEQVSDGKNRSISNSKKSLEMAPLSSRSSKWASRDFNSKIEKSRV